MRVHHKLFAVPAISQGLTAFRAALPSSSITEAEALTHAEACDQKRAAEGETPVLWQENRAFEVFVALACASHDPQAIGYFCGTFLREFEFVIDGFAALAPFRNDLRQRLCERLFTADAPALLQFTGRGPLAGWVRAAATRLALNASNRELKEQPTDQAFFSAVLASAQDAETTYLKLTSRKELQAAFERAAATLTSQERSLLKFSLIDRLNLDELAQLLSVHRATAARRLKTARERLVRETRAELSRCLRLSEAEASSIVASGLSGLGFTFLGAIHQKPESALG